MSTLRAVNGRVGPGHKYYVVIHGKCPGVYDEWWRVQQTLESFPGGGEYSVKKSKSEAFELFHQRRPDFPKHLIPDFTLHASNRLDPINKPFASLTTTFSNFIRGLANNKKSSSPTSPSSGAAPDLSQTLPRKIVLQQNWLHSESRSPRPPRHHDGQGGRGEVDEGHERRRHRPRREDEARGSRDQGRRDKNRGGRHHRRRLSEPPDPSGRRHRRGDRRRRETRTSPSPRRRAAENKLEHTLSVPDRTITEFNVSGRPRVTLNGVWSTVGLRSPVPNRRSSPRPESKGDVVELFKAVGVDDIEDDDHN